MPWRRAWQPTPGFLPGESHGQRSLAGLSMGSQSQTRLKRLSTHTHKGPHSKFSPVLRGWGFSLQVWRAALQLMYLGTYSAFNLLVWGVPLGSHALCEHAQLPVCWPPPAPPGAVSHSSLPMPMPYSSIRSHFRDPPSPAPSPGLPSGLPQPYTHLCYYCRRQLGHCSVPSPALHQVLEHHYCCSVSKLCLTLCDPADCSPPGSSVHGILQARILEWAAISSSRGSS